MTERERAIQIVNQLTVKRKANHGGCSVEEHEAEREAFHEGCWELAEMSDSDVQLVLAHMLSHHNTLNVTSCRAWRRMTANV